MRLAERRRGQSRCPHGNGRCRRGVDHRDVGSPTNNVAEHRSHSVKEFTCKNPFSLLPPGQRARVDTEVGCELLLRHALTCPVSDQRLSDRGRNRARIISKKPDRGSQGPEVPRGSSFQQKGNARCVQPHLSSSGFLGEAKIEKTLARRSPTFCSRRVPGAWYSPANVRAPRHPTRTV
jgi:hypothetical protein